MDAIAERFCLKSSTIGLLSPEKRPANSQNTDKKLKRAKINEIASKNLKMQRILRKSSKVLNYSQPEST